MHRSRTSREAGSGPEHAKFNTEYLTVVVPKSKVVREQPGPAFESWESEASPPRSSGRVRVRLELW